MARAILTSLLKKLSTWTLRASSSSSSAEQELQNLETTMKMIHDILEDAEDKDTSDESEQLRLRELKEVAYDAEDVLDEYEYEVLHMKVEARRQATASHMSNKHDKVTFDWNSFPISDELACRIKDIKERLEEINDWNRMGLSLREKSGKRQCIKKWKPKEATSYFEEVKTFGREDEKNEIIKWLLQEEEGDAVSILGIVGMGGLGKTTLAQMAYNDTRVCQHFNPRGWVYVSQDFNIASLVKRIHNSFEMYKSTVNVMNLEELHRALKVILHGKKFFLVLDDVWNLNFELWSSLKTLLVSIGVGKILITTRDERFTKIMQTTSPIYLSHLSFEDSWLLFKNIAYKGRDHDFLEIGKKVVRKCRGLPLAIKVLAGILREEDQQEAWNDVLENELWELDKENDDNIFPILKLSYDRLPVEMKQCFMYLCLFPKGSSLEKSIIIQQWMSHGFIQSKGNEMEEDVGNDICNEFLHRSILQYDSMRISEGLFIMHDLIHDLAQSVAKDEYLLITTPESLHMIDKRIRHVSLHIGMRMVNINLEPLLEAKYLRTLILSVPGEIRITGLLPNLKRLRTLVLQIMGHEHVKLWTSIGNLKHLRYLDIVSDDFIPLSVYNLHYLQTLRNSSMFRMKLSRAVEGLINLRHLDGYTDDYLPREVAGLTNLQTLDYFTLRVESDGMNLCRVRDLKGLRNLRGFLFVTGLQTVAWPDVTPPEAYLKDKPGIKNLVLDWRYLVQEEVAQEGEVADVDVRLAARVLDSLQPHRNLVHISIMRYPGVVLPAWLGHELPALKVLRVEEMKRAKSFVLPIKKKSEQCSSNPSAAADTEAAESGRWFPSLETLELRNMHEMEEWQWAAEDCDFPCLHQLTINDCPKLRTFPSPSRLSELWIIKCPELRLPPLPSLTKLYLRSSSISELLFAGSGGGCCLPMLRSLEIQAYFGSSIILPDVRSLDQLEELCIVSCWLLRSIKGLSGLASLRRLVIHDCPSLRFSPDERLPPDLHGVQVTETVITDEYRKMVLGVL